MSQVAAQSAADAFRFESLGARKVAVTGNLKFDMPVNPELLRRGLGWRKLLAGDRLVLLLAATREQEEDQLLAAFAAHFDAISRQQILLVVVPRHPQRFDGVFSLLATAGMKTARRSSRSDPAAGCEAWLGDSMGEMAAYYAMCDIAIIGGSFAPLGGQNLIEAAAVGKPTIIGPHVFNFSDAVDQAKAAGALLQVGDAAAAMDTAKTLLGDIERRAAMSAAALRFTSEHRGATDKTMRLISTLSDPAA
jgi:3-deoxy-D-manno-octulosonic-acid transferase